MRPMNAAWVTDYDMAEDKCYKAPGCPTCREPIALYEDGKYRCLSCGKVVKPSEEMLKWFADREGRKTEIQDCPKIIGCGGKKCVEVVYRKNPITLKWEAAGGMCKRCGMKFIV